MSLEEHDGACVLGLDLCPDCVEMVTATDEEEEEVEEEDWLEDPEFIDLDGV